MYLASGCRNGQIVVYDISTVDLESKQGKCNGSNADVCPSKLRVNRYPHAGTAQ